MTDATAIAQSVADFILETQDHAERLSRARALAQICSGLLIFLDGKEAAAEQLYQFADQAVRQWP